MKTVEQAKADKKVMTDKIAEAIRAFEDEYGYDVVRGFQIERWNGSNNAFGKVVVIHATVELC